MKSVECHIGPLVSAPRRFTLSLNYPEIQLGPECPLLVQSDFCSDQLYCILYCTSQPRPHRGGSTTSTTDFIRCTSVEKLVLSLPAEDVGRSVEGGSCHFSLDLTTCCCSPFSTHRILREVFVLHLNLHCRNSGGILSDTDYPYPYTAYHTHRHR